MGTEAIAHSYIRFSSKRQERGDRVRRQTELRDAWLARNGVKLSNVSFADMGVSAFKGANKLKGALSEFVRLAREGVEVLPGDYLVLEQVDRLSREAAFDALDTVRSIVATGVRVVDLDLGGSATIIDQESLTGDRGDFLLFSLVMKFSRAHDESKAKSQRVQQAREGAMKALKKDGTKIKKRLPNWIMRNDDGSLALEPKASGIMRRMISLAMDGRAPMSIASVFNRAGMPPISDRKNATAWESSTIAWYLKTRILIGEYQPTKRDTNGRRVPDGEPIAGYYPALLSEPEFYALQAVLAARATGKQQGRDGRNVANLFGRLLVDGYDNSTITLVRKHGVYCRAVSMNSQRGLSEPCSFPYEVFEAAFLRWVAEIEVTNKRTAKSSKLDERLGKLSTVVAKIAALNERLLDDDGGEVATIADALKQLGQQQKLLKDEIQAEKLAAATPAVNTAEVVSIADQLRTAKGDELTALRSRLRLAIASVVEKIELFPNVGGRGDVRHAGCLVKLRNGMQRAYQLRSERGKPPVTTAWLGRGDAHEAETGTSYRNMFAKLSKRLAALKYDDFLATVSNVSGTVIQLPWG